MKNRQNTYITLQYPQEKKQEKSVPTAFGVTVCQHNGKEKHGMPGHMSCRTCLLFINIHRNTVMLRGPLLNPTIRNMLRRRCTEDASVTLQAAVVGSYKSWAL